MSDFTILVVDDEVGMREVLKDDLEMAGYSVLTADSGSTALRILNKTQSIAVVFSDLRMPNGDGLFLLREIRKNHPVFPFVALMTGYLEVPVADIKQLGANATLTKPYDYDDLIKIVSTLFNEAQDIMRQTK